jgi:hypothetical protein
VKGIRVVTALLIDNQPEQTRAHTNTHGRFPVSPLVVTRRRRRRRRGEEEIAEGTSMLDLTNK